MELKYKLTKLDIVVDRFGKSLGKIIRHQGAQDLGCYGFWRDVKRVECMTKIFSPQVKGGLVVFLTNDKHYWQGEVARTSGHKEFSLSEKEVQVESKQWQNKTSKVAALVKGFKVDKVYDIKWERAYNIDESNGTSKPKKKVNNRLFQYCIAEI